MTKKQGWRASQEARRTKAEIRDLGMFVTMSDLILGWRLGEIEFDDGGDLRGKYPPERMMVEYLNRRGWKAERGGPVTHRTVQEVLARIDADQTALPTGQEERVARASGEIISGTEITCFGIKPEDWLEYRDKVLAGWKPTWRNQIHRRGG